MLTLSSNTLVIATVTVSTLSNLLTRYTDFVILENGCLPRFCQSVCIVLIVGFLMVFMQIEVFVVVRFVTYALYKFASLDLGKFSNISRVFRLLQTLWLLDGFMEDDWTSRCIVLQ